MSVLMDGLLEECEWSNRVETLLFKFARHVANVDQIPATRWGVMGMDLLVELKEMFPNRYDKELILNGDH